MASPALLFLLLVSSSLLLSTVSSLTTPKQNQEKEVTTKKLDKVKEVAKKGSKFIGDHLDDIKTTVIPFLSLIPIWGPLVKAVVDFALLGATLAITGEKSNPVLDAIKSEFESLNLKIDKYHLEQKWGIWASGAYQNPEIEIDVAWKTYEKILPSLIKEGNTDQREKLKKEIITACEKSQPATYKLHGYLTVVGPTFTENLANMLAEHVKCHEKDIREYTMLILKLMYKGNTLNLLCYNLKGIVYEGIVAEEADLAYESAQAMFQVQRNCILNSFKYIQREVMGLINDETKHQKLAEEIWSFLMKNYDRYDWMVVAYTTKRSERSLKTMNRHALSGFTPVTRGKVSISLARQVKGAHTQAGKVKEIINKCINPSVLCYKVEKTLRQCNEKVGDRSLSETYTAVHAFLYKGHDSYDGKEEEYQIDSIPENPSADTSYIHIGECEKSPKVKGGKFVVMIKSDEEILKQDPCSGLKCGHGVCVRVVGTFVAMCDCEESYYGKNCEESLEDYKEELENTRIKSSERIIYVKESNAAEGQ